MQQHVKYAHQRSLFNILTFISRKLSKSFKNIIFSPIITPKAYKKAKMLNFMIFFKALYATLKCVTIINHFIKSSNQFDLIFGRFKIHYKCSYCNQVRTFASYKSNLIFLNAPKRHLNRETSLFFHN